MSRGQLVHHKLKPEQKADLRLAASKMNGGKKRAFQAEMTIKYCGGSARLSETVFGWNRNTVKLALAEKRSGIICRGAKLGVSGRKPWEEKNPQIAETLRNLAEAHAQQDPTFKSTIGYTRLTASEAINQLKKKGYGEEELPKLTTMNEVLNRMGYRLRKVVKAKPQKAVRPRVGERRKGTRTKTNCQKQIASLKILNRKTKVLPREDLSE